jgi:molybdopterin-containing oxidoreductase family membrane subunit
MIFAVLKARPYWYTGLFPILFIVSALVSGGALLTFLAAFFLKMDKEKKLPIIQSLARLTGYILLGDLFLLGVETFVALYGNSPEHSIPYMLILSGPFWWVFWVVQICLGSVLPLVLIFGPARKHVKLLGAAAGLIVFGIIGVRLNIVIPPLQTSWGGGLPKAYHDSVSAIGYVPSGNEWLCTLGLLALGVWGFLLARRIIPLSPSETKED